MSIEVLEKHLELAGDGRRTGAIVVVLGAAGAIPEEGDRYVIRPHPGTEALLTGYLVNKIMGPRQTRMAQLLELQDQNAESLKEIGELRKTDPKAADLKVEESMATTLDINKMISSMGDSWREVDPEEETRMIKSLFKHTSCPTGQLARTSVFDNWFMQERFLHIPVLRREIIEHNRFLDMTGDLF